MKGKILKNSILQDKEQLFLEILFFLFGFILSFAKICGLMSPFCLVVAMSLNKKVSVFIIQLNINNFLNQLKIIFK